MSRTNRCKYEIIGEIMTSDEKEVDEKLYRVVRKKGRSFLRVKNTKVILTPCQNFIITALTIHF